MLDKPGREAAMPEISDEQFQIVAEIQALTRRMKRCSNTREAEFQQAQSALSMALNRLSSLPTLRDRAAAHRPGSIEA
jgi:hypothetical protein